jgi:hypothetical protein
MLLKQSKNKQQQQQTAADDKPPHVQMKLVVIYTPVIFLLSFLPLHYGMN